MTFAELLGKAWLMLFGFGVAGGLMYFIFYRDAHFWRYLSSIYGAPQERPIEKRYGQHAVAYGEAFASKSYNGILTIGVHQMGVALSVIPPFSFFHKPVFIPFSEIKGWKQFWYLNAKTIELEFLSAPDVKLVMPASQVKWIQERSNGAMEVVPEHSPHAQRPNVWYAIMLLQGVMGIGLLLYLIFEGKLA